jgi:hypothetical protein
MSSVRIDWEDVPSVVRDAVVDHVGSSVSGASSISGGFSPGLICGLTLENGKQLFVKGCSAALNPRTPTMHADEIKVLHSLPESVPHARIFGDVALGDWTLVITDFLSGSSASETPLSVLAAAELVRAISQSSAGSLPRLDQRLAGDFLWNGMQRLQRRDTEPTTGWHLNHWVSDNLSHVIDLELQLPQVLRGDELVHGDLRADNVMIGQGGDSAVCAVDWPAAARGNSLFDAVLLAGSIAQVHHLNPSEFLSGTVKTSKTYPKHHIAVLLAGFVGHYSWASSRPEPPGIEVRSYQRDLADVFAAWLEQHLGD